MANMKVYVEQEVFDIDFNSEHAISIVSEDDWSRWVSGDLVARIKNIKEKSLGDFSGNLYEWEFRKYDPKIDEENERNIIQQADREINDIKNKYKIKESQSILPEYIEDLSDRLNELFFQKANPKLINNFIKFQRNCWVKFAEYIDISSSNGSRSSFNYDIPEYNIHVFGAHPH